MLKVLRVARLLRVFRYMRSFRLLQSAISSKSKEMFISLQFLVIVTLIGRIIACIIGLLGIALFAVPAGLIGAGFSEAMGKELHKEITEKNIKNHSKITPKIFIENLVRFWWVEGVVMQS